MTSASGCTCLLDERSAAFFALGAAKASGQPTLVLCTSGTAAAHFHPAVLEADHSRVPLIVCTADRPAELRDTGAPQTTDQVHLYGSAVRFFADLPADGDPAARAAWRPIAARVWAEAAGPPAGPVHLNVAFREPLRSDGAAGSELEPGRDGGRPWVLSHRSSPPVLPAAEAAELGRRIAAAKRGLVVAGWGIGRDCPHPLRRIAAGAEAAAVAELLGWPLLADAISGQRSHGESITTYEALLRVPGFAERHKPDLVIRFGGPLTSKTAMAWLDASVPQILVDPDGGWLDPQRAAAERVPSLPDLRPFLTSDRPTDEWHAAWREADKIARTALDGFLDSDDAPFEGRVARDVAAVCAASERRPALVVASSMPVRDLEAFAGRVPEHVYANRGVNGIDGLVSTVLGVATTGPAVGLLGDLAFLHDAGGLLGAPARGLDAVFVVVDNGGGGIFSFLPQAALPPDRFELLFGTPPGADVAAVAKAYGLPAERVERAGDVGPALERALAAGGVQVLVVPTGDRTANVDRHRQAWAAVAEAMG